MNDIESMNLNITQENLHLLLPGKVTALARFYAEDHRCSMLDAMRYIYTTSLYQRLSDESTKLWHLGVVDLYREL